MSFKLRAARKTDATDLAVLVNYAGEGMPLAIWQTMTGSGQSVWDVGRARAERDEGAFSWRNAVVAEMGGSVAGMIVTYMTAADPAPITEDTPAMFHPLIALENAAPETLYVNILAVKPEFRRHGIARRLMLDAEREKPAKGMSLIVANKNHIARAFYAALGYREQERAPVVEGMGWRTEHTEWILITKA